MDYIHANQFVTEYVGEILTSEDAEIRGQKYDKMGQTYLFDLDYNEGDCLYTIDAYHYGNVAHFVNHSVSSQYSLEYCICQVGVPNILCVWPP